MATRTPSTSILSAITITLLLLLTHLSTALPYPLSNLTLPFPLPRSPSRVDCEPSTAFNVVTFFFTNFLTHVATAKSSPGTNFATTLKWSLAIFLLPYSGIVRGCIAISRGRKCGETALQQAARSGALAYVARGKNWRPRPGETISHVGFRTEVLDRPITCGEFYIWAFDDRGLDIPSARENVFHGQVDERLWAEGYDLRLVQPWHDVEPICEGEKAGETMLGNEPSCAKAVAAIVQMGSACYTLWKARGEQVDRCGYAAFGLAVVPYAVMSLVNLIAAAVNADYPAIYLIQTEVMDEAVRRGLRFSGIVGMIRDVDATEGDGGAGTGEGLKSIRVRSNRKSTDAESDIRFEPVEISKNDCAEREKYSGDPLTSDTEGCLRLGHRVYPLFYSSTTGTYDSTYSHRLPDNGGVCERQHSEVAEVEILAAGFLRSRWTPHYRHGPLMRWLSNFTPRHWIALSIGIVSLGAPYVIIGYLTDWWKPGTGSTALQRGWMLAWYVVGSVGGVLGGIVLMWTRDTWWALRWRALPTLLLMAPPAIGGCVVVVREILEFGSCVAVG